MREREGKRVSVWIHNGTIQWSVNIIPNNHAETRKSRVMFLVFFSANTKLLWVIKEAALKYMVYMELPIYLPFLNSANKTDLFSKHRCVSVQQKIYTMHFPIFLSEHFSFLYLELFEIRNQTWYNQWGNLIHAFFFLLILAYKTNTPVPKSVIHTSPKRIRTIE